MALSIVLAHNTLIIEEFRICAIAIRSNVSVYNIVVKTLQYKNNAISNSSLIQLFALQISIKNWNSLHILCHYELLCQRQNIEGLVS